MLHPRDGDGPGTGLMVLVVLVVLIINWEPEIVNRESGLGVLLIYRQRGLGAPFTESGKDKADRGAYTGRGYTIYIMQLNTPRPRR